MTSYPIEGVLPKLKEAFLTNHSVVLHAPPGAGKTTRVPLALLDMLPSAQRRIVMLEPRRIAAVSAARWMAQSLQEQAGGTVGYRIRFDSKVSAGTRIEVVTEGILTRRIQADPGLDGVGLVIFDEFHERSVHADLALALCLDVRRQLRPDLRVLIMSATIEQGPIAALLGNAAVITSAGRAFPVEERYVEPRRAPLPEQMAAAVGTAIRETHGDILAFLPGAGEIRACAKSLQGSMDMAEERLSLHPLYGDLPFEEQERAILPAKDHRKIVLATNIAETSLTIEGVHVVIDSGLTRRLRYDPSTGMNRLVTVTVSRASAEQRKGRAGRLGPGFCYRLYSRYDLQGLPSFAPAEILESDLASLVLELAAWGIVDPAALSWIDPPPQAAWNAGRQLLRALGALDPSGAITAVGREMARLPLHPRLSRMMLRSSELGRSELGADMAAILSERDLFRQEQDRGKKDPDMAERVHVLGTWRRGREGGASADPSSLRAVDRAAKQILRLVTGGRTGSDGGHDQDLISRLLLSAFPDRVCKRRDEGAGHYVLAQGRGVRISQDSHLINSAYLIAVTVDAGGKEEGAIHIAAPVSVELIRSECAGAIESVRKVEWDVREGRIASAQEERLGALLLSTRSVAPVEEEVLAIVCDIIRTTPGMLNFSNEARQFQARVDLMRRAFPEETWADLSDRHLLPKPEDWLRPWLAGIRSAQGIRALDVLPALKAALSWEQLRLIDARAPATIVVPSGSRIRIDYASGEQPVLAVKLQELFGLADTPRVAEGRVKVLLHLLSPARRPVQVTTDLKGFWNSGYLVVKKELKGRYPKHPWPEDPWNALPTRRTKRRGQ